MAVFRSIGKLRQVLPELKVPSESFSLRSTWTKGRPVNGSLLYREIHSSRDTLWLCASVTSVGTPQRPRPHRVSFKLHPDDQPMLSCSVLEFHSPGRKAFHTSSHLRSSALTQESKTCHSSTKGSTTGQPMTAEEKGSSSVTDASSEKANESSEVRNDSGQEDGEQDEDNDEELLVAKYDETGKPLSNWTRMKMMMKAYSYVIIPVHWIIAPLWFGAFYYSIKMGVDIGPFLLKVGISEHHVDTLKNSGASNALMAYALYKIFTPLRYTVTVGATEMTIRYLRRKGYIKPAPRKEKTYRESLKETVQEVKEKIENR